MRSLRRAGFLLGAWLLLVPAAEVANACPVEGVIDWRPPPVRREHMDNVHDIYTRGWDEVAPRFTGRYQEYVAWDNDIFTPLADHKIGQPCKLEVLTGAGVVGTSAPNAQAYYSVYRWIDVNQNYEADNQDRLPGVTGQLVEQSWKLIVAGPADKDRIFDLFNRPMEGDNSFVLGLCYILLIRAYWSHGDSWQWVNGTFSQDDNGTRIQLLSAEPAVSGKIWDADCAPYKYGTVGGGCWRGVDDYETLWLRVNQPPYAPGPHGPRR